MLDDWRTEFARTHEPMLAWTAIGLALSGGDGVPTWTHDYLRDVAQCLIVQKRYARPTGKAIAPAIKAALLEPAEEIGRVRLVAARRQLARSRARVKAEHRPAVRAILARDVERDKSGLARLCAGRVRPRCMGPAANPFRSDFHKVVLALEVRAVLPAESVTRAGERIYRQAASNHAKHCERCATKPPNWHTVKAAWLAHKAVVTT